MARQKRAKADKSSPAQREISSDIWLSSFNIRLLVLSLVVIVAGFVFLSRGSVTLAPILLVLGYCVMVPFAIVYRPKSSKEKPSRKN
jgi:hypothetical protein